MDERDSSESAAAVRGNRAWSLAALPAKDRWWEDVERGLIPRMAVLPDPAPPGAPSLLARFISDEWWAANCVSPGSPSVELLHLVQDEERGGWKTLKRTEMPQGLLLAPEILLISLEAVIPPDVAAELVTGLLREMGGE